MSTPEEKKYNKLKEQFDQMKVKLDKEKARLSEIKRKKDTKRKIVGGGFFYKLLEDGRGTMTLDAAAKLLKEHIEGETVSKANKAAFEGWDWPGSNLESKSENPVSDASDRAKKEKLAQDYEADQLTAPRIKFGGIGGT